MKKMITFLSSCFLIQLITAQVFIVDTINKTGPLDKRINLVYLADGYTATEQGKFLTDVIVINNKLFNTVPFKEYKNYFNVFAVKVVSAESGIKHANNASDCPGLATQPITNPLNYFGTKFDAFSIHRLVVPDSFAKINAVLAANFPDYDQVLLVGNTSFYGGSGGPIATSTTNSNAAEIMIHEIGHSFAGLADEYWAGSQYAAEKPNMTSQSNATLVKWKNWIGTPNIGVFQHSGGTGWYKPTTGGVCKMEVLNPDFCNVCKETFVERVHTLTTPLDSYFPANATSLNVNATLGFKINLINPIPNTLKRTWKINNIQQALNLDSFTVLSGSLPNGNHTVLVTVLDTTVLSRAENHINLHTYNIIWNLSVATGISEPDLFQASLKIYPNPFQENLLVQYQLEKRADVSIQLVSLDGKQIPLVQVKKQNAGSYNVPFSLEKYQLTAGTYFVVFTINGNIVAKEIIKLK